MTVIAGPWQGPPVQQPASDPTLAALLPARLPAPGERPVLCVLTGSDEPDPIVEVHATETTAT